MSLHFIYQVQARLYGLLSQTQDIRQNVAGLYLSVQHDAKYPFILINILKTHNISKHGVDTYEIDFEICIFAREKTQEFLLGVASRIVEILKPEHLSGADYDVLSIKDVSLEFVRGHDLLTNKALISYKALLQHKNI